MAGQVMRVLCHITLPIALLVSASFSAADDSYQKETVSRTAISGVRTKLGQNYHINNDCSLADVPVLPVVKQPSHGKIEIMKESVFPTANGSLKKCNSVKIKGVVAYYTSKPGFSGRDTLILRTPFGDGKIREMYITINVLK